MTPETQAQASAEEIVHRDAALLSRLRRAIVCTDMQGTVTLWNDGARRLFGWEASEMIGRHYVDRFPEGDIREKARQRFESVKKGEELLHEREDYRKDGSRVWVEARIFRFNNVRGLPEGTIGLFDDITQRRAEQQQLQSAHDRISLIARATSDILWDWDLVTNEIWYGIGVASFGYTQEDIGRSVASWTDHIHPDDRARVLDSIRVAVLGGAEKWEDKYRFERKDGSYAEVLDRGYVVRGADGKAVRLVGVVIDITERLRAEQTLQRDSQILSQLQESVICTDINGFITYWNEGAERLLGWKADELVGHSLYERFPPQERTGMRQYFDPVFEGKEFFGERHDFRKDGTRVWVESRVTRFNDAQGKPVGIIGISRDISERKIADAALMQSEREFRSAMEHSAIGMALVSIEGRWLKVNQALCKIIGYTEEELQETDFQSITYPDDLEEDMGLLKQLLAGEIENYDLEKRYYHKKGYLVWILLSVSLVRDAKGQPKYFISQIQDITERKEAMRDILRAKEVAEEAARAKSEFLAVISHEIRTPLNPILGAAQLLLDQKCDPSQRELLEIIRNAGEHLLILLSDILDLAKMEAGGAKLSLVPCQLDELLHGVFDIKREEAGNKKLELNGELEKGLALHYMCDEPRVRQILLNLVGNGVKFTEKGGVTVKVERLAADGMRDRLRFSVRDTGIGISPEQCRKIFQPFYQVDSSSSRRYEGAGLGLAICRRLVEIMDGEIGVESKVGQGSTFWFSLWLGHGSAMLADVPMLNVPLRQDRRRILLVEDDERNRSVIVAMLERSHCQVTVAETAEEALKLFQPGAFDVVFMDLRLPDMDGCEAARQLREREVAAGAARTPIIAQTANTGTREVTAAKQSGMDGFLSKPIHKKELVEILHRFAPLRAEHESTTSVKSPKAHMRQGRKS